MKRPRYRLLIGLCLAVVAGFSHASAEIGRPAPGFSLTDTAGRQHALADYQGRTVVLEWTNHECPFVRKHYGAGNMQDQQRAARADHDVVWLSIISSKPGSQGHVGPAEADELTASRNAAPSAVLLDESGDVGRDYDARVTPHMYIVDAQGTLVYKGGIDSIRSASPVDIPRATQYVMAALDEMAAGQPVTDSVTRPYGCTIKY